MILKSGIEFQIIYTKNISRIVCNGNRIDLRVQVLNYLYCVRYVYYMITDMLELRVDQYLQ